MNISYDNYRIFYYVAKYQSFTQAAQVLMNNQPNITRTIRNLETALGCKLFIRSNRGAQLTPEGEKLYAHIALAFEHIQTGEDEIKSGQSLQGGIITIASSEIALHCCLLPVLKEYRALYPGVRIRVSNHSTPQAMHVLKNGLADFAVVTTPTDAAKALHEEKIREIQEVPICSTAFSSLCGKVLTLQELFKYPLISLCPQSSTFSFYTQFFSQHGLTLKPDIEAATADQILPMVKSDLGIGFVPEEFVRSESASGNIHILTIEPPIPKRSVCLLKRKGQSLSIAAKALERMIISSLPL